MVGAAKRKRKKKILGESNPTMPGAKLRRVMLANRFTEIKFSQRDHSERASEQRAAADDLFLLVKAIHCTGSYIGGL